MMRFKQWLNEVAEPQKPSSKVDGRTVTKDRGTNVARRVKQYKWTTKLGNDVTLFMEPKGDGAYDAMFYVNDVLYDFSSTKGGLHRDPEILSGVFYLIKDRARRLKAKELTFRATSDGRDTKIIRNLDYESKLPQVEGLLAQFEQAIRNYEVQMIPPNAALYAKLNKPLPDPRPDLNKDVWLKLIDNIRNAINNNQKFGHDLIEMVDQLKTGIGTGKFNNIPFDVNALANSLVDYANALKSHSPSGWERTTNRRASIYSRLMYRHFADEWDIEISGDSFRLYRKDEN